MSSQAISPGLIFDFALNGAGGVLEPSGSGLNGSNPRWIHLEYSGHDIEEVLGAYEVDPRIVKSLLREDTRPRTAVNRGDVIVFLRAINMNRGANAEDMVSLRMLIQKNRVITLRQRKIMAIQDVRESLIEGTGPTSLQELVILVIESLADRISSFVESLEVDIDEMETSIEQGSSNQELSAWRSAIFSIRRQIATVRRYLSPQREALDSLSRLAFELLDRQHVFLLNEQSDRINRSIENLHMVNERTLVLQDVINHEVSKIQNARMYLFSVVTVIFLPISFVTGLFGVNVQGMPGVNEPLAFWLLLGTLTALSMGSAILLKRNGYF